MSHPPTSPISIDLYNRFGHDGNNVLKAFNPGNQIEFCRDVQRCYFGKSPTIGAVQMAYGHNTAESWIQIQLNDLAEFSGCKGKLNERQSAELAAIINTEYGYLKLTELMLFFQKFKRCEYGKFYGAVDPMVILEALKDFCEERHHEYDRKKKEEEDAKNAEERRAYEMLRQRYRQRVPDAFMPTAPLTFTQYRLCGYDCMTDEELYSEIQDILTGKKQIPKDAQSILAMLETIANDLNH